MAHFSTIYRNGQMVGRDHQTYYRRNGIIELHPANDAMKPILVKDNDTFQIEGLVVGVIRHLRK